jgi:MFS family permease
MHPPTPFSPKILFPLTAMLAVLTTSSMAVTVIAVLAPAAAPEIGVDATRIGDYTAIVYLFATLSGAVTGALVGRFGAIRVCQITMLLAALAMLAFTRGTLTWVLISAAILGLCLRPLQSRQRPCAMAAVDTPLAAVRFLPKTDRRAPGWGTRRCADTRTGVVVGLEDRGPGGG